MMGTDMRRGKKAAVLMVLAALAAASAAAYGIVSRHVGKAGGRFFRFAGNEAIDAIELENSYGKLKFWKGDEGRWTVRAEEEGAPAYTAGREKMELLLSSLKEMEIGRYLEADVPEYGFGEGLRLTFLTSRGNVCGFTVGNQTMTKSQVYVRDDRTGRIGITDLGAVSQLGGGVGAFRDREIFRVDMDHIREIACQREGEAPLILKAENGSWEMESPYRAPAREIEITELLAAMKDWNLCAFADTTVYTEEQMGLAGGGTALTLTDAKGERQTLRLGAPIEGVTPVRSGGKDDILLLYADEVDISVLEADRLLFFAPLKAPADQVEAIGLTVDGVSCELDPDSRTGLFWRDGQAVDPEAFYSFYLSYMALTASGGDETAPPKGAGELAVLRTAYRDGTSVELRLLARDEESCYMVVDDRYSGFYMSDEKLIALKSKLDRLGVH